MRGQSRTRQTLSDAREPMNLEDGFGDPGQVACDDYRNKIGSGRLAKNCGRETSRD